MKTKGYKISEVMTGKWVIQDKPLVAWSIDFIRIVCEMAEWELFINEDLGTDESTENCGE